MKRKGLKNVIYSGGLNEENITRSSTERHASNQKNRL